MLEIIAENLQKYYGLTSDQADSVCRDMARYALAAVMDSKIREEAHVTAAQGVQRRERS
jgi:hypothetical protein